ncbi:amidohydrolase [candidate division KSB1 bacterium]|nr:amidohydrolase [candidate division KSB1 bacterium]
MNDPIIDMHFHFGTPPDETSGCFWSKEFERSIAYFSMLLITRTLFKKVNFELIRTRMLATVNESEFIQQVVWLAMDHVYDDDGVAHPEQTHLYVPNRFLAELAQANPRVLFGASVHPNRPDWRAELDFCLQHQAVLCKWIPSSQQINPADRRYDQFYEKLAQHQLPLLCHAGPEHAIPTSKSEFNKYNNPQYLEPALELGVTVIVAHCALPFFWIFDKKYQDDFQALLKLFEKAQQNHWKLYADLSALCFPQRSFYIETIQKHIPPERLLLGSDYPVPLFELTYHKSTNFFNWIRFLVKLAFMKNLLDKNYLLLQEMGFQASVFTNAARLFAKIQRPT